MIREVKLKYEVLIRVYGSEKDRDGKADGTYYVSSLSSLSS